jgi:hypothetical protein
MAQDIWLKDPTLKDLVAKPEDVDGLISDATFVGLPGNEAFFKKAGNLSGFPFKMQQALALPDDPAKQPLKGKPKEFLSANLEYATVKKLGGLAGKAPPAERFTGFGAEDKVDTEKTIYSFNIYFEPNQGDFPEAQYGQDFQRALEQASLFGNAVVAMRGHADPSLLVTVFRDAALRDGVIRRDGAGYKLRDGKPFNLNDMNMILEVIKSNNLVGNVRGNSFNTKEAVEQLEILSKNRAAAVRNAVINYGRSRSLVLDQSQMRETGVGVREPAASPSSENELDWKKNRRVEFSIIKVPAEKVNTDEFEL